MNVTGVHSNAAESGVDQPFIFHFQVVAPVAKEICYWMDTQVVKTEQCFAKNPLAVAIVMKVPLGNWIAHKAQ
jgi:hypothetical protein